MPRGDLGDAHERGLKIGPPAPRKVTASFHPRQHPLRLRRLEVYRQAIETPAVKVAFANLTKLPRSYAGARQVVKNAAQSESGGLDQYEERPGAGRTIGRKPGTVGGCSSSAPPQATAE